MFWKKSAVEKLPGPRDIPGLVQNHIVSQYKMDADLVRLLKGVVHKRTTNGQVGFNIRVFDQSEAWARKVQVKDYTTLDATPNLIIYDGWYDDGSKQVNLEEKKKVSADTPLFSLAEIREKVEALSQPGSTIFFYLAAGPTYGGPLGQGAAVVELNPNYPGKKEKKYILYTADVVDMQPVGKGTKLFGSDKAKEIAQWIKDAHHKRMY